MRMHLEGVKNTWLLSTDYTVCVICGRKNLNLVAAAPISIVVPITIAMATSVVHIFPIPLTAMTPETVVRRVYIASRAAPIPAPVACVMAVNKLFTLPIHV